MIRLTVLYGHPTDPAEFDRYYREVHIPLASQMKGLKGWTIGKCQAADPGEQPPYYMIVGLYADSREDMESILKSPGLSLDVTPREACASYSAKWLLCLTRMKHPSERRKW